MLQIEYNKSTGKASIGQHVQITENPNFYWTKTPIEAQIHKAKADESIWLKLSIKQIAENSWESTICMRAPGSPKPIEIKSNNYIHTFNEAIDLFRNNFPDEYKKTFTELF